MRRTTQQGEQEHESEARLFFGHPLCVDGDLTSIITSEKATDLLAGMLSMLTEANLYLQKVSSNYSQVTEAFLAEIHVKDLIELDRSLNPSLKASVLQSLDVSLLQHTLVKLWDHLQDSGEIDCILGKKFKHLIQVCWTRYTCKGCRTWSSRTGFEDPWSRPSPCSEKHRTLLEPTIWHLHLPCIKWDQTMKGSIDNSLYDSLGFVAPIIHLGKAFLRELSSDKID